MPGIQTAPPRLFQSLCEVVSDSERKAAKLAGNEPQGITARFTFDLERVIGVNEKINERGDGVATDRCSVDYSTSRAFDVVAPYADVVAAWVAYRTHADAIGRLRN